MTAEPRRPGLYLHIPFCSEICPYCDFAVLKAGPERQGRFAAHLVREGEILVGSGRLGPGLTGFDTVYFGGGTPSILPVETLARIRAEVGELLAVMEDAWVSLEANPEDVTVERLAAWRRLGVRTLSLGVQSFDEEELRFLGRRHTRAQALQAVEAARAAGFDSVSIDLIYALPGQTEDAWRRNLRTAVSLAPDHLSCYELTIHQGTPFERRRQQGELVEVGEDQRGQLFLVTHQFLADAGWHGYEVSNFARSPDKRSRHNSKYWDHTPYLGLGPSAHSFDGTDRRWWNERRLADYGRKLDQAEAPVAEEETLHLTDLLLEAVMLGLRTSDGLDRARFRRRFGVDPVTAAPVETLEARGLLRITPTHLRPTLGGMAVADSLAVAIAGAFDV